MRMSPSQPGYLGCLNGVTPKRHLKDERSYFVRNENAEVLQTTPKSCNATPISRLRSRRLFVNRPNSVELSCLSNRRYSCSEPTCHSAGSSPVNKSSFSCGSGPYSGFTGIPDQISVQFVNASQNLKKKKYGPRQQHNQSSETLKALAERYASSRYSDSPKAKQLPLPPVDWIDEEFSRSQFSEHLTGSNSSGRGSPVFFGTSFLSRFNEDSYCLESSPALLEKGKVCRGSPIHMNPLQLIESVSAS